MGALGGDRLFQAAEPALRAGGDAVQVLAINTWGGLTRFASSRIHQNVWSQDTEIKVQTVLDGGRSGVAGTHALDAGSVARAAAESREMAGFAPPDPHFPGLAPPATHAESPFDEATAEATPAERADLVSRAIRTLAPGQEGAGAVETSGMEVAIANTSGLRCYARIATASMSVMAMEETSSGFAETKARRLAELDAEALASRASGKAVAGRSPRSIEPGRYTVILEPAATGGLLEFLGYIAFGARNFLEGRSALAGRIGERIAADVVTIVDDPLAPGALGLPFDFEGTPARPVTIVDGGIARDVVWDRLTAARANRDSTGHGLPAPNPEGPLALNLRMAPGATPIDDLVSATERGLLVTRFHYTNVVSEKETVLTGMTRDGTFLIENGALAYGVTNLRYTQNALEALCNVEALGDRTEVTSELGFGGCHAPAARIRDFNFSSATTH